MPETLVAIALVSPPLDWPGFGLNVSNWLGPPDIQSKMHFLPRFCKSADASAMRSVQLIIPVAAATPPPAAKNPAAK